jgi:hypothetical protein
MKNSLLSLLLPVAAAFFLSASAASVALAQDAPVVPPQPSTVAPAPTVSTVPTQTQTTVTTTGPDQTKTTQTTVTTVPEVPAVALAQAQPGQHVAEIEIILTHGDVQAYFGRAPRGEKFSVGDASFSVKLPSTATVTKLASRDKTSDGATEVTVDNPWHVTVPFSQPGRYVFNIVEWDDDPAVALALVKVDGVVKFEGHGRDDDIRNWPQKTYGEGVHRTGSREIAFDVE